VYSVSGIALFVVGGVTGVFLASIPVDLLYHGTYYVVGHFHFIVMGVISYSLFAASYYWYPLLTGRMYSERLAGVHAVLTTVGTVIAFGAVTVIGALGLPRRSATYPAEFALLQQAASVGAALIFAGVNVWIYNLAQSYRVGPRIADADPWDLRETGQFTREWRWLAEQRGED
jgi:cytochrome c oxidase subunit 1